MDDIEEILKSSRPVLLSNAQLHETEGKVVPPVSGEITDTRRIVLVFPAK